MPRFDVNGCIYDSIGKIRNIKCPHCSYQWRPTHNAYRNHEAKRKLQERYELRERACADYWGRPIPPPDPALLLRSVDDLELSIRSANCLKNNDIVYVGELVQKTEAEMLRTPNFGRKSLLELKETLVQMGMHFGMKLPGWRRPENTFTADRNESDDADRQWATMWQKPADPH